MSKARYSPAGKLALSQAQFQALLTGTHQLRALGEAAQSVVLHAIYAPGPLARLHPQARLLRVDGEHRELGLAEGSCKKKKRKYYDPVFCVRNWNYNRSINGVMLATMNVLLAKNVDCQS